MKSLTTIGVGLLVAATLLHVSRLGLVTWKDNHLRPSPEAQRTTRPSSTGSLSAETKPKMFTKEFKAHILQLEERKRKETTLVFPTSPSHISKTSSSSSFKLHEATMAQFRWDLNRILDEFGYVVVENVLSEEECQQAEALFNKDLRGLVSRRNCTEESFSAEAIDHQLLENPSLHWPLKHVPLGDGPGVSDYGLACGEFAMHVRLNEKVRRVFYELYKSPLEDDTQQQQSGDEDLLFDPLEHVSSDTDLCVGLDSVFFEPPQPLVSLEANEDPSQESEQQPQRTSQVQTERLWPHADHNVRVRPSGNWRIFQSSVHIWGSESPTNASTTVIWPKSHKEIFAKVMEEEFEAHKNCPRCNSQHFIRLPEHMLDEFVEEARRIPVPRGGMIVWNSKTIHQGWSLGPRLAQPVCYEPKARRAQEALERKIECVKEGQLTSHWASLGEVRGAPGSTLPLEDPPEVVNGIALHHTAHYHALDNNGRSGIKDSIAKWL